MYGARGWGIVEEACDFNRISKNTLDVMWQVVAKNQSRFVPFLNAKAKWLGKEKLPWYDLIAPLGEERSDIPYEEAVNDIIRYFGEVSPKMARFVKKAIDSGWVESEDRKDKQSGAFCTNLPKKAASRGSL